MASDNAPSIRSYSLDQLEEVVSDLGQPKFRAKQLHEWLHEHNASSYDEMTNLPKALRERLSEDFPLQGSTILQVQESADGTRKYLLRLSDGAVVECVGILDGPGEGEDGWADGVGDDGGSAPRAVDADGAGGPDGSANGAVAARDGNGPDSGRRLTVCCSTQVGCAMKCSFCATGCQGLERNLTADEIVDQVIVVGKDFGKRVSNVVIMGQGEPFQNYDVTLAAMKRMNGDGGLDIGARHITVSTSGLCDGIKELANEPEQFRLAVSLHAADQETRNALMPRLSGQNLKKLHSTLENYCDVKGRRVTLEYMLLDGVNDSKEDLQALIDFCEGLNVHVNLLSFNAVEGIDYVPSGQNVVRAWQRGLEQAGIPCSVRKSKGADIAGACGQLRSQV